MTGVGDDSRGFRVGKPWFVVGSLLAVSATLVLVLSDDARWLRLGIVAALWAALVGAFFAAKYRRHVTSAEDSVAQAQAVYELELEREISARREYELEIEAETRDRVEANSREELDALRLELAALRESLQSLMGGEVLYERVALTAQATRMRSLQEQRVVQAAGGVRNGKPAPAQLASSPARTKLGDHPTELIERITDQGGAQHVFDSIVAGAGSSATNSSPGSKSSIVAPVAGKPHADRFSSESMSRPDDGSEAPGNETDRIRKPRAPRLPFAKTTQLRRNSDKPETVKSREGTGPSPLGGHALSSKLDEDDASTRPERPRPTPRPQSIKVSAGPELAAEKTSVVKQIPLPGAVNIEAASSFDTSGSSVSGSSPEQTEIRKGLSDSSPHSLSTRGQENSVESTSLSVPVVASSPNKPPVSPSPMPEGPSVAKHSSLNSIEEGGQEKTSAAFPPISAERAGHRHTEADRPTERSRRRHHAGETTEESAADQPVGVTRNPEPESEPVRQAQVRSSAGGRRRRPEGEPSPWDSLSENSSRSETGHHAKAESSRRADTVRQEGTSAPIEKGSHTSGRSVTELLAAHGAAKDSPRRRRRAAE